MSDGPKRMSVVSAAHGTIMVVTSSVAPLHLVLGDEELLMDRAVAAIVTQVRANAAIPGRTSR